MSNGPIGVRNGGVRLTQFAFECRSLGNPCEWALRTPTREEIVERIRVHARCAHNLPDLPADVARRVDAAIHIA